MEPLLWVPPHPFPVHTSTPFLASSRQQRNTYGQASFQVGSGGVLGGFPVAPKRAARSISPGAGSVSSSLDGGPCSFSVLLSTIFQEITTSPLLSAQGSVLQRLCSAFLSGAWSRWDEPLLPEAWALSRERGCAPILSIWGLWRATAIVTRPFLRPLPMLCFPAAPAGTRWTRK